MTLKDKKELDKVLQIVMPDDYYEDMRKLLLPHLIKWYESKVKNLSSKPVLADSKPRHCPKCNSTNVIMFDSDNDLCNDCGAYFC